jgi:hypothetical protein
MLAVARKYGRSGVAAQRILGKNGTAFLGRIAPLGDGAHTLAAGERTSPSSA